jgi:hypothetical protein
MFGWVVKVYRFFVPKDWYSEFTKGVKKGQEIKRKKK